MDFRALRCLLVQLFTGTSSIYFEKYINTPRLIFSSFFSLASSGCDTNCFGNSGITFDEKFVKSSFDFHWEEERWLKWGNDALTLAVMSILITAPLGAVCILGLGPKLLESDNPDVSRDESQNESEEQA